MNTSELSLIKFQTINFFSIIINARPFQPIATILIKLVNSLIQSEPEPNIKTMERLEWIYKNTHKEVLEHISLVELAVYKNIDRGLNREIEIGDKGFYLSELYKYLDEISLELTNIVTDIVKKYSLDIPIMSFGHNEKMKIDV